MGLKSTHSELTGLPQNSLFAASSSALHGNLRALMREEETWKVSPV